MQTIQVVKPFMLQLDPIKRKSVDPMDSTKEVEETLPSEFRFFEVGVYDVEDNIAAHWFVRPHLKGYEPPPPTAGMAEFQAARAAAQTKVDEAAADPVQDPSQPMPSDARPPRRASLPPGVTRAEPIA